MLWKRMEQGSNPDETPTEPAPAMHSYLMPKFPPDPRLPTLDEAFFGEEDYPRDSGHFEAAAASTFRPAQVLRHVYTPIPGARAKSA